MSLPAWYQTNHYTAGTQKQGSYSFTDRKNPRLSRTPWQIFQDLFGAHECLNIKQKTAFTCNIQSVVHCRKFSMKQNMCYTIAACFPFEPLEKCMTFKHIFPGLSRTLSFNFQDFPGRKCFFPGLSRSWNFQEKNPGLSSTNYTRERCTSKINSEWQWYLWYPVQSRWRQVCRMCNSSLVTKRGQGPASSAVAPPTGNFVLTGDADGESIATLTRCNTKLVNTKIFNIIKHQVINSAI